VIRAFGIASSKGRGTFTPQAHRASRSRRAPSPPAPLPIEVLDPQTDPHRILALARLRAGLQPDEADGHFDHALAALAAGEVHEAEQATLPGVHEFVAGARDESAPRMATSSPM